MFWGEGHDKGTWYDGYTTSCKICGESIHISGGLEKKIVEQGYTEPSKCERCKDFLNSHSDQHLSCKYCGEGIVWKVGSQLNAHLHGGYAPTKCDDCRAFLDSHHDKTLACKFCGDEVHWSVEVGK
jgi:ribosomal protein S27E